MLEYRNDCVILCDTDNKNKIINTYSTDTFRHRITRPDWHIEYAFNSLGYRTKELSELNDKFLLTFGCSYTEGVGLSTDQIWTHAVSQNLNLDLYNAAKQTSGLDIPYLNTLLWNSNNLPTPDLVIVQWPQKARKHFGFKKSNSIQLNDKSETNTPDGVWWGRRYIVDTGEMSINLYSWFESFNNTWKLAGVPVLNFTWDDDLAEELHHSRYKLWTILPTVYDKARDRQHDGPIFHQQTADRIKEILTMSNFTDKI
tara:strand:- start:68 stop:835 length:768 start_codon:yes stop_codon:yes gene_type:complete